MMPTRSVALIFEVKGGSFEQIIFSKHKLALTILNQMSLLVMNKLFKKLL